MEITPRELRDTEIALEFRGYDRDAVNDLLERTASALESLQDRVRQLTEQVDAVQAEAGRTRETEDILHRTLLLAQRAADEAVGEAQAKARQMVEEAEIASRKTLAEAEADARRRGEAERRRLEAEVVELAARRDSLLGDVEGLTRFEAEYRERMARALEADLAALRARPSAAPGPRPDVGQVEVPAAAPASAPPSPEAGTAGSEVAEQAQDADATGSVDMQAVMSSPNPTNGAIASAPTDTPPVEVPPRPAEPAPPAEATEEDEQAEHAEHPERHAGQDIDLDEGGVEAEVLDDDAFFATLREAVHDETPLGPRDDDDDRLSFFDDEGGRPSFRDVFRRRR